ncbi:hypothetical protein NA57DRAFT_66817 [Rhizodiscina lignyota]|uniref:Metallo-beta-lactamase domain-containing protein n=1 Tax=Rhizodiscina lignyota TaxID=1504668 RepID=A0A9P4ID89_9PEZI|nr:hypothetical protein NA57DRAFT_66817 [Rhizodiscina lignyota]
MSSQGDIQPEPTPDLHLPKGDTAVQLSIINAQCDIVCPSSGFVKPIIKGHPYLNLPTFCFHIRHPSGKEILFDLGGRKDYWNFSPNTFATIKKLIPAVNITKGVDEILTEGGVDISKISAMVISHWHWDHLGDPSLFPKSAELIVGPGFKKNFMPGYPAQEDAHLLETDFEGRTVREPEFSPDFKIGQFEAYDYFGDGSFYILNVPGHATGHISGLARTTKDTFVFCGGDVCHFGGSFRPTQYAPMPAEIPKGVPLDPARFTTPCPCSIFTAAHPNKGKERTSPYYEVSDAAESWYVEPPAAQRSINALQEFDASPNVMVCIAHDEALPKVVDFFPNGTLNDWQKKGWKPNGRWGFLNAIPVDGKESAPWITPGLMKDGELTDWSEYKP